MQLLEQYLRNKDVPARLREAIRGQLLDRQKVEGDLRKHIQMIDFANDTIMIRTLDDRIVYWNQGAVRLYGWKKEEAMGQHVHTFLHTVFPTGVNQALKYCLRKGHWAGELKHIKKDGTRILVFSRWTLQRDAEGKPMAFLEINHDITALKKAEQELQEAHDQLEKRVEERTAELKSMNRKLERLLVERRRLEKEILNISDMEQRRIGQDLHDGLSQHLTGIGFMGKVLEKKLSKQLPEEASDAHKLVQLVDSAITQTRNLARGLYPVELESSGLLSQLRDLCSNTQRVFGISCHFQDHPALRGVVRNKSMHLFRIAQEAVNNAVRHGKPQNIWIRFTGVKNKITMSIQDDGVGIFRQHRKKIHGLGLRIMRYRAEMIGGFFEIQKLAEGGTKVVCVFDNKIRDTNRKKS